MYRPCALLLILLATAGFDLQGHRGARGLAPENTLPGFAKALGIGVTTLELDTGVTRDGVVVVSHDRALNPSLARGPDGAYVSGGAVYLRNLDFAELQAYDVGRLKAGSRAAGRFPDQVAVDGTPMPALAEVFALASKASNTSVRFNIETKLRPDKAGETVAPKAFVTALLDAIDAAGMAKRVTIQSFDWRTLRLVAARRPEIETVCLTAEARWLDNVQRGGDGASPWTGGLDIDDEANLAALVRRVGCGTWSPWHKNLSAANLAEAKRAGLGVVPWTVNEPARMAELIEMGIDGLITDYPDRLRSVMATRGMPVPAPTPVQP